MAGRAAKGLAGAWVWLPVLALVPAGLMDRGPGGEVRFGVFPAASAALDPWVWDCAWNSLAVAAGVTLGARVAGVGLARVAARWRFWGRPPLAVLAAAGLAAPPAFSALGLRDWFGPPPGDGPDTTGWLLWGWVALAAGTPLVALAAGRALAGVDPAWEDAAALAGATRQGVWRRLLWPVVRPPVAGALAVVFAFTLLEPGAPLALGLRRTLSYQIVEAATDAGPGRLARAAVLTLIGVGLAGLARALILAWGGAPTPVIDPRPVSRPERAGRARGLIFAALLAAAGALAVGPLAALVAAALRSPDGSATRTARRAVASLVGDPLCRDALAHSAGLGLAVLGVNLILAKLLASQSSPRRDSGPGPGSGLTSNTDQAAGWSGVVPPLAVGVGVLVVPWVLTALADLAAPGRGGATAATATATPPWWAGGFVWLAAAVDPARTPWVALVWASSAVGLPMLARSASDPSRAPVAEAADAARVYGVGTRQARRLSAGRRASWLPTTAVLAWALAASAVAPALVLAPAADTRPAGPAVLALADDPDNGRPRAAALALALTAANLVAFALAARDPAAPLARHFRG